MEKKFSEIVNTEFPNRPIRVVVGNTVSYIGINSRGLKEMQSEQVKWLDSHKIVHCWYSQKEIEIVFKGSKKYDKIVWKDMI